MLVTVVLLPPPAPASGAAQAVTAHRTTQENTGMQKTKWSVDLLISITHPFPQHLEEILEQYKLEQYKPGEVNIRGRACGRKKSPVTSPCWIGTLESGGAAWRAAWRS